MKTLAFFSFFLFSVFGSRAQLSYGGLPLSFRYNLGNDSVVFVALPTIANSSLYDSISEPPVDTLATGDTVPGYDTIFLKRGKLPYITRDVNVFLKNGSRLTLASGETIIRLGIICDSANSICVNIDSFCLDSTEQIFVYSFDHRRLLGAYTPASNYGAHFLMTGYLNSDTIIIEYNRLDSNYVYDSMNVFITSVNHEIPPQYRVYKTNGADCFINANCPQWNTLCNEIRANVYLGVINRSGSSERGWSCSGVLIADADNNYEPYILTAKHCLLTHGTVQMDPERTYVEFNLETPACDDDVVNSEGIYVLTGVEQYWTSTLGLTTDLALLKMRGQIPIQYNVYYAGWDRETDRTDLPVNGNYPFIDATMVHHPGAHPAKVSQSDIKPSILVKKWFVHWDQSSIADGSSGAPLFDVENRVIGTLSGGLGTCDFPNLNDYCGKLGKFDDFGDVIATQANGNLFASIPGTDPMLTCQNNIKLNGDINDAQLWRNSNDGSILVQAADEIDVNSEGNTTSFNTGADYILQAGNMIVLEPGHLRHQGCFIYGTVNKVVATIAECLPTTNSCYNFKSLPPSEIGDNHAMVEDTNIRSLGFILYPNPANKQCTIKYTLSESSAVEFILIDLMGKELYTIDKGWRDKGTSSISFNTSAFASGVYLVKLTGGNVTETRRLVIAQ